MKDIYHKNHDKIAAFITENIAEVEFLYSGMNWLHYPDRHKALAQKAKQEIGYSNATGWHSIAITIHFFYLHNHAALYAQIPVTLKPNQVKNFLDNYGHKY